MPTYDYVCEKCGKEFEVFQSMNDARLEKCLDEACDGRMKRRIGTGAGVIFKGSGFYGTDYRSESYKEAAKKESGASSESGSSSGGKASGGSDSASTAGSGTGAAASKGVKGE
jgi:putative FmdB family regulatory protein